MRALIVTAPESLRAQLRVPPDRELIEVRADQRPDRAGAGDPSPPTSIALRSLARRHRALGVGFADLDELLGSLVAQINPGRSPGGRRIR